jgi:hypothetical protein
MWCLLVLLLPSRACNGAVSFKQNFSRMFLLAEPDTGQVRSGPWGSFNACKAQPGRSNAWQHWVDSLKIQPQNLAYELYTLKINPRFSAAMHSCKLSFAHLCYAQVA